MNNRIVPLLLFITVPLIFFYSFFLFGKLPIPADTIVGLYHPFRDLYIKEFPRGIPFKNSLITDPVRQQYPWRFLAMDNIKNLRLPLWNPYNSTGIPLLANFQTAVFYPFNLALFLLPFSFAWSILIFLQPLLGGLFIFLYLKHLRINLWACFLGALVFSFSGFNIAWLEWNTIGQTTLWLPLILLAIDKIVFGIKYLVFSIKNKNLVIWFLIYLFSLVSAFFAGHLQIFFYLFLVSILYFLVRWFQYGKSIKVFILYLLLNTLFFILTFIQWYPTLQFLLLSAREIDLNWLQQGWFIPWQNLVQFIVPDFFGNPATLNYWGIWNYGEFIGYIGILPLTMSLYALFFRYDRKTLFYGFIFFLSLLFSLSTFVAKIPFLWHIPFISTAQPTRLLFITDFSLAILSALGFDYFIKFKYKLNLILFFTGFLFGVIWLFLLFFGKEFNISAINISIAERNALLPSMIFIILVLTFIVYKIINDKYKILVIYFLLLITVLDLLRFANKFTTFSNSNYLYPSSTAISFLQKQPGQFRMMTSDTEILPPNFSIMYKIQSVDSYDPLYLLRFGELIAASERGEPNIKPPFGFNRIINPHIIDSKIIDLMGVKYVLSLSDIINSKLTKVFQEGKTKIYQNRSAMPRAFFVTKVYSVNNKSAAIAKMYQGNFNIRSEAVVEYEGLLGNIADGQVFNYSTGSAKIIDYTENHVVVETNINKHLQGYGGFLILTDSYYPIWHVKIDDSEGKIWRTDYNFRGVEVPAGKHKVGFYLSLL
jgi:hypothetical protein